MEQFTSWMQDVLGLGPTAQWKLLATLLVFVSLFGVRRVVLSMVHRRTEDVRQRYRWHKSTSYVVFLLGLVMVVGIWAGAIRSLGTFLGLVSAGLAIALKDLVVNLAGWGFILWRRPFQLGDRIQIGEHMGDVIDVRIFQFTLMEIGNWVAADQSTGRVIHVPNGKVLSEVLANYSRGFQYIWNELPVVVTFESDWRKAKSVLEEIINRHGSRRSAAAQRVIKETSRKFMIFYTNLTPIVYTRVVDIGVELTIRYLCDPQERRGTAQEIWEDVLDAFARYDNIDFAYPTQRFYDNRLEGKPGARATVE
ncbi:MAG: mechanosensitive ion channel protein MscS [Gemmatimonas sp. SG8_17]|nr:MAG: mechanosensitive ion channel protein MscS [Gemmatimonas sp. SG8_17]